MLSKVMPRIWYSLLVAVLSGLGGLASAFPAQGSLAAPQGQHPVASQAGVAKPANAAFTRRLVGDLRKSGFQTRRGYPHLYTFDDCQAYTYPLLKNCFGNNPAAPYVVPVVKSWPKEYVDPATVNAFGQTRRGYSTTYRLHRREAIVIHGRMPPPGRYMGLQTFEFSQQGRWKAADYDQWANTPNVALAIQYVFSTIPPNDPTSERVITLSALGDIVNNVVMQRRSGYPFAKKRYFVITPSAATNRAVRGALQAQGVRNRRIFTEQVPRKDKFGQIGPLGMGKKAIDFWTAFRYAIPDPGYEQAAAEWRNQPPLKVLRVRAPASVGPVRRYGSLSFEKRTAHSEAYLAGDLQNLVNAACDRARSTLQLESADCTQPPPASSLMVDPVRDYGWTGPYCRKISMDCLGDQQDAAYYLSGALPLDSGQVYAVVGTLATQTGNATYAALSVNDASTFAGAANILDTDLRGSAEGYANTVSNTDKFFVHYFTRDCAALGDLPDGAQNCTGITPQMAPLAGDTTALGDPALHGMVALGLRNYIAPGTKRGPDSSKLLTPRTLTFSTP